MGRVLEAIFRRPLQLILLLVIFPALAIAVVLILPPSYETTASLWALRRYEVIGATGPETNLQATPAETQATALSELLQSRTFALKVASQTQLASTLDTRTRSDPLLRDDALFTEISKHVLVRAVGYNLFTITYENKSAQIAQQVVNSVIENYSQQSQQFSIAEAQYLLQNYQGQLVKAQQDAANAAAAEARYLTNHPDLAHQVLTSGPDYAATLDPAYGLLHSQTKQAQATVENLQSLIASLNQEISSQGTGTNSLFKVIDSPSVGTQQVSRMKSLLIGGAIGLVAALVSCSALVIIQVRRNRAVYTPLDLQKITTLPVLAQLPRLGKEGIAALLPSAASGELLPGRDGIPN
ncbi:Wzz/FepE/Etk N-terminal domain-containing protein [Thermogemmatispora onikobensis]|uniref:Wzz/FepE/Etk N-terminal domain-containing protein n=1 Tax=Thermogemmatispora onikobensis TaxID=732234 RepID=UPI000853CDFE|nr:Wzz/FepE/Etk N-terminal domain-containing protein [Thermogemmatispora onikobensis]